MSDVAGKSAEKRESQTPAGAAQRWRRGDRLGWAALGLAIAFVAAFVVSEVRWARINSPRGRFDDLAGYLSAGRPLGRAGVVGVGDAKRVIVYGQYRSEDAWLAMPSGPPAYVFDGDGRMVDWTNDAGEDGRFAKEWPTNRLEWITEDELRQWPADGSGREP